MIAPFENQQLAIRPISQGKTRNLITANDTKA